MNAKEKGSPVLLFVILVGVVLFVAWMFGSPTQAIEKAKKLQTNNNAISLKMALTGYYDAYEKFPELGMAEYQAQTNGQSGTTLLTILLGTEDVGGERQNPRQIQFLNAKANKNKVKGGLVYNNGGTGSIPEGFYDAWGEPFHIYLRKPGSATLGFSYQGTGVTLDQPCAVLSKGPDKKVGTKDDIKTW